MQGAVKERLLKIGLPRSPSSAWPVVALWLYQTRPVNQATLWTILGGFLLLPVGASIKIAEGIPQLDKISIPVLAALVGCFFFARRPLRFWNGFGLAEVLVLIYLIGPFVTSELNADAVVSGSLFLPSLGGYDGLSATISQLLFVLPFLLGRRLLKNSGRHRGNITNADYSWAALLIADSF